MPRNCKGRQRRLLSRRAIHRAYSGTTPRTLSQDSSHNAKTITKAHFIWNRLLFEHAQLILPEGVGEHIVKHNEKMESGEYSARKVFSIFRHSLMGHAQKKRDEYAEDTPEHAYFDHYAKTLEALPDSGE